MEPLADYSDEQIGAAARDVLRDSATVINRFFAITALSDAEEGSRVEAPENFDPQKYRLAGQVSDAESRIPGTSSHPLKSRFDRRFQIWKTNIPAEYAIGVDLGTTNSVLSFTRLDSEVPQPESFPLTQIGAAHTTEALPSLPSFCYLASETEMKEGALG